MVPCSLRASDDTAGLCEAVEERVEKLFGEEPHGLSSEIIAPGHVPRTVPFLIFVSASTASQNSGDLPHFLESVFASSLGVSDARSTILPSAVAIALEEMTKISDSSFFIFNFLMPS